MQSGTWMDSQPAADAATAARPAINFLGGASDSELFPDFDSLPAFASPAQPAELQPVRPLPPQQPAVSSSGAVSSHAHCPPATISPVVDAALTSAAAATNSATSSLSMDSLPDMSEDRTGRAPWHSAQFVTGPSMWQAGQPAPQAAAYPIGLPPPIKISASIHTNASGAGHSGSPLEVGSPFAVQRARLEAQSAGEAPRQPPDAASLPQPIRFRPAGTGRGSGESAFEFSSVNSAGDPECESLLAARCAQAILNPLLLSLGVQFATLSA